MNDFCHASVEKVSVHILKSNCLLSVVLLWNCYTSISVDEQHCRSKLKQLFLNTMFISAVIANWNTNVWLWPPPIIACDNHNIVDGIYGNSIRAISRAGGGMRVKPAWKTAPLSFGDPSFLFQVCGDWIYRHLPQLMCHHLIASRWMDKPPQLKSIMLEVATEVMKALSPSDLFGISVSHT